MFVLFSNVFIAACVLSLTMRYGGLRLKADHNSQESVFPFSKPSPFSSMTEWLCGWPKNDESPHPLIKSWRWTLWTIQNIFCWKSEKSSQNSKEPWRNYTFWNV